ncbi:conserved hypothetical protein [Aspergillus terreus NIH2624]|uniref:Histone-lysine N-methyltransferase, H3 lysine-36 specific n=1 Tax=Aspergillus terreus (strain NIH 2624 / FGSC A1156) TaxID=341663 RepID=Q0CA53_ASPTN|nr:uncharacterized protein ATEG_09431 [Aspergillus terreus NIH2624]EAU30568.1 conserved hypothetical protein [Aspergillus terreus NIH2624]
MPTHDYADRQPESVANAVTAMKLDPNTSAAGDGDAAPPRDGASETPVIKDTDSDKGAAQSPAPSSTPITGNGPGLPSRTSSRSPVKDEDDGDDEKKSVEIKQEHDTTMEEEKVGGGITVKLEPGQPPKLTRSSSQKVVARPPQLFSHLPDSTAEAQGHLRADGYLHEWGKQLSLTPVSGGDRLLGDACISRVRLVRNTTMTTRPFEPSIGKNLACGEDSDCINRATKIECMGDCGCVFGMCAETDLRPHQFIFEYVGEVINEGQFRRRMRQYDEEGIKHFYFMSLSKGEFVDATKKGNLGRFCNHSCNPNCYVDKWVVGEKLRMGIFAERRIQAGEELVFNYNVDRYGADPQPCYCGEPNCTGFIGGRTQTERATKLSNATIEALGIDDADSWDTAVARRPRKKKMGEDDEEYVDSVQPKSLDENGVTKVMAALMQCKEKWIAVKLLGRIQRCDDERVCNRVVKMHGYQILNSQLAMWKEDHNVVLQILDILDKFPRLTRNKIIDSKIESTIQPLTSCGDERVEKRAETLLQVWSTLEVGYRIPRMKRDPNATSTQAVNQFERRESTRDDRQRSKSRSRSRSRSIEAPRGPAGHPRGHGRGKNHPHGRRSRRQGKPLPAGWFAAESNGRTYYYSARGDTTWTRPTKPAPQPPPPPKESRDKALQDIIDGIMNAKEDTPKEKAGTPGTPQLSKPAAEKKEGQEKWRQYSEEKQKKLYENTLFPHVKYVVDKFKHKLPKEDLKRYAKDVAKKLVNSDFKNNRVQDPTRIDEKQQKKVKKFCKEFFDKAVQKHRAHEQRLAERHAKEGDPKAAASTPQAPSEDDVLDVKMSDDEGEAQGALKRKRDEDEEEEADRGDEASKRPRSSTPPPPPPPPMSPGDLEDTRPSQSGDDFTPTDKQMFETPPPPPPPPPLPAQQSEDEIKGEEESPAKDYPTDMAVGLEERV